MMRKNFVCLVLFVLFISCTKQKPEIRVGFSYSDLTDEWGKLMYQEVVNETSLYQDSRVKLITRNAINNRLKQNSDIQELINEKIDVLIIFAVDSYAIAPLVAEIYDKGIPVVIIDRKPNTSKYSVFISNDNVKIGFEAGKYAVNKLNYKGKVLEILGTQNSSTSFDRSAGFHEAIKNFSGVKVGSKVHGDWLVNITEKKIDSVFRSGFVPDLVFAHSDVMALSARKICDRYNIHPFIIGIDGLPTKGAGIDMVLKKQIDATFYNYPGGDKALQSAVLLVQGKKVSKDLTLKTFPIDLTNAESMKVGFEIQLDQFEKIKKQQSQIDKITGKLEAKNILLYLSIVLIGLLVLMIVIITYFLKQKQGYISLIRGQKEKIEQKIEEERTLSDQLIHNHRLLQSQSEEILIKNENLEKYQNQLEQLVQERTQELEIALKKAQESDMLKTSFLSNLSHEIRTPLNAIIGFTNLLQESNFSSLDNERFRSIIIQNSNQLLNSITQIVETAKLSSGQVELKKSRVSLTQFFWDFKSEMKEYLEEMVKNKGARIKFKVTSPPGVLLDADFALVKQVLIYLIDNAFKFTDSGYIELGAEIVKKGYARFYVKDTGRGIGKEDQEIIFDKFRKLENDKNVLFRGIGLGLAISKQIVELMEGEISVQSEQDKGAEFSFTIQGVYESADDYNNLDDTERKETEIKGKTILIAEDEDSNFVFIETLLKKKEAIIKRAKNGLEAVNYCQGNRPDVVLMDIKMPIMDGIEAFKKIRAIYPRIPVMALTAYAFINEERQILGEGFDGYLSKPYKPEKLYCMIEGLISSKIQ